MRGKWFIVVSLGVILSGALGATWFVLRHRSPASAPVNAARSISLPANFGLTFGGTVRPQHVVNFGPTSPGTIDAFLVEVGEEVYEGQPLARIGSSNLETDRENAQNNLDRAQDRVAKSEGALNDGRMEQSRAAADLERARTAFDAADRLYSLQQTRIAAGAISRLAFEKSEKDYQAAQQDLGIRDKAQRAATAYLQSMEKLLDSAKQALAEKQQALDDAQKDLDNAEIRAPVSGFVVARKGQVGEPAESVGDQMFQVATDLAAMEVAIQPKPEVLKRIVPGMQALVLLPEITNAGIAGQVKAIDGAEVVVEFVSPSATIRPGLRADVRLKLD